MNYEYIEQLLERYWECTATLEEDSILRAFFSQNDVPASLLAYKDLFAYEQAEISNRTLGEAFDKKILSRIGNGEPVKAHPVSFNLRMRPLYKAVAVVAVILTLGNAIQMSFDARRSSATVAGAGNDGTSAVQMAQKDSAEIDSTHHTSLAPQELTDINRTGTETFPVN